MNKYCSVCGKKKGFFEKLWHGQEHCSWCQIHQPIAIEYGELVDSLAEGWVLTEADERRFDDVFAKHCGTDCLAIEKLRGQLNSSGLIRKAGAKLKLLRERSRLITGSSPEKLFHFVGQAQIKAGLYPLLNSASINIEPLVKFPRFSGHIEKIELTSIRRCVYVEKTSPV